MGDFGQWTDIDEAVAAYIDRSEQSVHKQFKLTQIAFDGMRELGIDFFNTIKTVKLPVNANLTVNLPPDYQNWAKVGVLNDRGEVIPLYYNNKLTFFADQQADRLTDTQDATLGNFFSNGFFGSVTFFNFWDGNNFTPLYGLPSGSPFVGSFKIDNNAALIVLDQHFIYPYVILEYVANPQPQKGTYFIPSQFKEALIAYIGWKDIASLPNTRRGNGADKAQRRKDYYNERRLARARYKPLSLEQAFEESLRNQRFTVKA